MTTPETPEPLSDYLYTLRRYLIEVQYETRKIEEAEAFRKRMLARISELVEEFGVPEEAKFAVAAFRHYPTEPEKNHTYTEWLRAVDEQIKSSAGESLAWLTSEVDTSHPFNPAVKPDTETKVSLHIGLLPQDARLIIEPLPGRVLVPVEKSVAIPINGVHLQDGSPSFEDELNPLWVYYGRTPILESNPVLQLYLDAPDNKTPIVFGNKAVEELLGKNELQDNQTVIKALHTLTTT